MNTNKPPVRISWYKARMRNSSSKCWGEGQLIEATTYFNKEKYYWLIRPHCRGGCIWITSRFYADPNTICQWTGRYDSLGRKLFENDIVEIESGSLTKKHGTIVWDKDGFFVKEDDGCLGRIIPQNIKIIGNIFDTTE